MSQDTPAAHAPSASLRCIAIDADDTLWHNEHFFKLTLVLPRFSQTGVIAIAPNRSNRDD